MRDLQPSDHGRTFSAVIHGNYCKGVIDYNSRSKFKYHLCQDVISGHNCGNKHGYKYSYYPNLSDNIFVKDFKFINMTAKEIEEYKDFKKGDVLKNKSKSKVEKKIVEQLGIVLFTMNDEEPSLYIYTANKLHKNGWRLDVTPEEEEKPIVELSVAEIAKKLGLSPEQLKVVDK